MERSRNGTLMSLNSQDFENLESVEELYFGERETEDNQERAFTFSIIKSCGGSQIVCKLHIGLYYYY